MDTMGLRPYNPTVNSVSRSFAGPRVTDRRTGSEMGRPVFFNHTSVPRSGSPSAVYKSTASDNDAASCGGIVGAHYGDRA